MSKEQECLSKTASFLRHWSLNLFVSLLWYLYSSRDFQGLRFLIFFKGALQLKTSCEIQPVEKKKDLLSCCWNLFLTFEMDSSPWKKDMRNYLTELLGLSCRLCGRIQLPGLFWSCSLRPRRKIFSRRLQISTLLYTSTAMGPVFSEKHRFTTSLLAICLSRGQWWRETLFGALLVARSFGLCKQGAFIANCQSTWNSYQRKCFMQ